jgi:hypothetical protein
MRTCPGADDELHLTAKMLHQAAVVHSLSRLAAGSMGITGAGLETPGPMRISMKTQVVARSHGMARSSDRVAVLTVGLIGEVLMAVPRSEDIHGRGGTIVVRFHTDYERA